MVEIRKINSKKDFKSNSLVSIEQFSVKALDIFLKRAGNIKKNPKKYSGVAEGKVLYSIFWANSTRTRVSTETAWLKMGGKIVTVVGTQDSSIQKGETLEHTLQMYAGYQPDFIALRTHIPFIPGFAAENFPQISWINCGDGSNEHPTQALLDLFTLKQRFGELKGLKIGFVGDIKHGRTVKSLAKLLKLYEVKMKFIAPASLHAQEELSEQGIDYQVGKIENLKKEILDLDVIYSTRPQLERMDKEDKQKYQNGVYQIDKKTLGKTKALIMSPLPIDSKIKPEIHPAIDKDPRAIYFEQAANGLWARMSIFSLLIGE
jgi:aspartate carbamoyltransferase catalytic subunit